MAQRPSSKVTRKVWTAAACSADQSSEMVGGEDIGTSGVVSGRGFGGLARGALPAPLFPVLLCLLEPIGLALDGDDLASGCGPGRSLSLDRDIGFRLGLVRKIHACRGTAGAEDCPPNRFRWISAADQRRPLARYLGTRAIRYRSGAEIAMVARSGWDGCGPLRLADRFRRLRRTAGDPDHEGAARYLGPPPVTQTLTPLLEPAGIDPVLALPSLPKHLAGGTAMLGSSTTCAAPAKSVSSCSTPAPASRSCP
jgi:hypothetical protein